MANEKKEPKIIKTILLTNNQILVSEIAEVGADIGQPDCKLTYPFALTGDAILEPWMLGATKDDVFMISSDKIVTLAEPTPTLLEKYIDLTK